MITLRLGQIMMRTKAVLALADKRSADRLMMCGALVEREAKKSMSRGGGASKTRTGKPYEYWHSEKKRWVTASIPPAPPHVQLNALRASITHARYSLRTVVAGPTVKYGIVHEYGGRHHPKRPFMRPALRKVQRRFGMLFKNLW